MKKLLLTKDTQKKLLDYNPNYDLMEFQKEIIESRNVTNCKESLEIRYDGLKVCFFDILKNGYIQLTSRLL